MHHQIWYTHQGQEVYACGSVSCLINMEPSELLRLQPSEPIASESLFFIYFFFVSVLQQITVLAL